MRSNLPEILVGLVVVSVLLASSLAGAAQSMSPSGPPTQTSKLTEELIRVLSEKGADDPVPLAIWLPGIDYVGLQGLVAGR